MQLGLKLAILLGAGAGAAYLAFPQQPSFPDYALSMLQESMPARTGAVPDAPVELDAQPPIEPSPRAPRLGVPATAPFAMDDAAAPGRVRGVAPLLLGQAAPAAGTAAPAAQPPQVDESALRYFARQGDTRRLEAEIARLKALYPDWTPPADPLADQPITDQELDPIWALYAEGRIAEARSRIAERQARDATWQPPQDLLDRLALAEARQRLINASDLKQYDRVVELGSANPALLICAEMDVLWRVAEAFAGTERQARSADVYRYILQNCNDPGERLATIQKAIALLDEQQVQQLLSLERKDADGQGEFESVRDDLARSALAKGGEDPTLTVAADQLSRIERLAQAGMEPDDALLLGWYNLRRDRMAEAERWFRLARERQDSGVASEGLALALMARGNNAEAEAVIYPWRADSDDRRKVYLAAAANLLGQEPRVALSAEVLSRIVAEAYAARDVATARQLGWYARAYNQHDTAGQWFATALGWDPDDEASAYGLALTRFILRDTAGLRDIQSRWAGRSQRIEDVGTARARDESSSPDTPAPATGNRAEAGPTEPRPPSPQPARVMPAAAAPKAARSPRGCTSYVDAARLSPGAALTRGWCLMEINRPHEAAQAFEVALRSGSEADRRDASYGQSLAYLRAGLTGEAAVAATRAPQSPSRVTELQAAILAERALGAYEHGRYVDTLVALDQRAQYQPEPLDLMVLRGYAYLNLNRTGDAQRIFQAVAGTGNREGLRGLAAVREKFPSSN